MNRFLLAIAALVGTIVGAGVLGLPYVFAKSGILIGLIELALIGAVVIVMNLMLSEVSLRTKASHMLPRLTEIFLGKTGKILTFGTMFVGIWGAMLAYIIGVGKSLAELYGNNLIFGLNASFLFSIVFFAVASTCIYFGLKTVAKGEVILGGATVLAILIIAAMSLGHFSFSNLTTVNWKYLFLPYGVVLFAMLGASTVPEIRRLLDSNKEKVKKAVLIGTAIPIVLYAIFAITVVAAMGLSTTEIATIGLGELLGPFAIVLGNIFAIVAMSSSYIILGLALRDSLVDGLHMTRIRALLLTVTVPLILFLVGLKSFISVIGITGAVAGGLEGILIALMWRKARKKSERKPEFKLKGNILPWIVITVFSLGIIYTVISLFI